MDIAAKHIHAGLLVLLEQGGAGKAHEHRVGHHGLHHSVQLATLGTVAFIYKHKQLTHGLAGLALQVFDKSVKVIYIAPPKLVYQRAQQAGRGLCQLGHQIAATASADFAVVVAGGNHARLAQHPNDLFVQLVPIGDDDYPGIWVVFQNPLGQQHHHNAFSASLGVPDDAAFALAHMVLCGLDAKVLVHTGQLFYTAVKQHKVKHQLQQPCLGTHFAQVLVQLKAGVAGLVLFPLEEKLLLCADAAVLQALGVVTGQHKLHSAEKPGIELRRLVRQALANALANAPAAVLQLQYPNGDAIDIQHQVRPAFMAAFESDLFSNGEVVGLWLVPVDQWHRLGHLAHCYFDGHTVAEQFVYRLVVGHQAAVGVVGLAVQGLQHAAGLGGVVAAGLQEACKQSVFNIAIACTDCPVA